jgi:hypothetical protein
MRRSSLAAAAAAALALVLVTSADPGSAYAATVSQILAQPYQPDYVPLGLDAAFAPADVANVAPAEDYTTGSIQGSADAPMWSTWFTSVTITRTTVRRCSATPRSIPGRIRASSSCTASTRTAATR